jgi:hypothetical protein
MTLPATKSPARGMSSFVALRVRPREEVAASLVAEGEALHVARSCRDLTWATPARRGTPPCLGNEGGAVRNPPPIESSARPRKVRPLTRHGRVSDPALHSASFWRRALLLPMRATDTPGCGGHTRRC